MLDLDALACKQAQILEQPAEAWCKAVWTEGFQRFIRDMSDGEVESLISMCPSVEHLHATIQYLMERHEQSGHEPFSILVNESNQAGLTPAQWIASKSSPT